jgi:hypothetical protein
VTVLPFRWLLRAPGNLRARLGALFKDKGSGLIKPIETHRKRTDQCKELEDSDAPKQRSPGLRRDKATFPTVPSCSLPNLPVPAGRCRERERSSGNRKKRLGTDGSEIPEKHPQERLLNPWKDNRIPASSPIYRASLHDSALVRFRYAGMTSHY